MLEPVHSEGDQPWDFFERMMLKLKLQYSGHLMRRVDSLEKTVMLGGTGGKRRRGRQRMRWLDGITDSMDVSYEWTPGAGDGQGGLACCNSWGRKESDTTERLIWSDVFQGYLRFPFLQTLHVLSLHILSNLIYLLTTITTYILMILKYIYKLKHSD